MYGIIDLNKKFSTGQWLKAAIKKIKEIKKRKKIPILVGGTGLYFQSLIEGLVKIPEIPLKFRNKIRLIQKKEGQKKFYKKLLKIDPKLKINLIQMILKEQLELLKLNHLQKFLCMNG